MTFAELIMGVKDYASLDSETLLWEYVAARESYEKLRLNLESQIAALTKESAERSEAAMETRWRMLGLFHDANLLLKRITAITRVVVGRFSRNAVNRYFGLLKIGDLQGDVEAQDVALRNLYNLFASIPPKNGWFHPENRDGLKGIAHLLLTKELNKHRDLDLRAVLKHMMDNRFAYLYVACQRDFIDFVRERERQAPESVLPLDELEQGARATDLVEDIHCRQLSIRLRELAPQEDNLVRREIIHSVADLLGDRDSLSRDDRVIRAELVSQVSGKCGVRKQWVRRCLTEGTVLSTVKQVLSSEGLRPKDGFRVILTEDDEEK